MTGMTGKALMALGMVGLVVAAHGAGVVIVLRAVVLSKARPRITPRFWSVLWLFIWVPLTLIVIHLFQIGLWGLFFWWQHCFLDIGSSLYFAGSTYTTLGYGDLVLPAEWRQFGPLTALTGMLSAGLSVGLFVAVVGAVYQSAIVRDRSTFAFAHLTALSPHASSPTMRNV
jgi:hypothetical protein